MMDAYKIELLIKSSNLSYEIKKIILKTFVFKPKTNRELYHAVQNYNKNKNILCSIEFWDVSDITSMAQLFANKKNFNHDLSLWDVSNVIDMSQSIS